MVPRLFKNYSLPAILCLLLVSTSLQSFAQLVTPDAFLKGQYVEVGLASNGTFGSANAAPAGYHGRSGGSIAGAIGFVADPDKDGWGVGTPTYFGDYFLPASPAEGWALEVAGVKTIADRNASTTGIGANISVTATGSKINALWQGVSGNVNISQTTTLDTNNLYFVVTVKLKNTGSAALTDIYYCRMVNPDNEVTLTSTFNTIDTLAYQTPNATHKSLAVARGTAYGAYLGLGAKDCRAKVFLERAQWFTFNNYSMKNVYNEATGAANLIYSPATASINANNAIGIIFNVGTLAAGDSTTLSYAYILKEEDLDAAFATVTPNWDVNGQSYASGDTVKACPGTVLPVKVVNGGSYAWNKWIPVAGLSDTTGSTTNITVGTGTVTYFLPGVNTASACDTLKDTLRITVKGLPVPGRPVTAAAVNYCLGATASALSATAATPGDTLKWYDAAGTLLPAAPTPVATTVGRTTYYVSGKNSGGCESLKDTIFVSVNPNPLNVTATPSGSIVFCAGDSVTLVGAADVTGPTGMTGFASAGAAGGTVTTCDCPSGYVAVGYEGNTGSWMDHFNLLCKKVNRDGTLGTTTIATATNGTSYGGGYNGPYTYAGSDMLVGLRVNSQGSYLNAVAGYGHDYAYIFGYGSNPAGATSLTALSGGTAAYDLGYLWAPDGNVVTGMAAYNASYYSSGVALRYTPVGAFKYKYSWSTGGDTTQNKVVKTSGAYTLTVTNSYGCPAQSATVNVTVNPLPVAVTTTTNVVYCQNATATALTATATSATDTLKWYNAANTLLPGAPVPVTTTAGTTTYYVSQKSAAGCEGPKTTITVKVNPVSTAPTTTTPIVYCQNATASVLTATLATAADTMKWYNAANTLLSSAPTPVTTSAGTTLYYVSEKNAFGCESPKVTITVKVNPTPDTAATTKTFTYCEGVPATVLSAVMTSDSLKWYDGSSVLLPAAPTPPTTTAGTYTYYVSQKNTFGCEGLKTKITVTVNPTPAAPVVTTPVNLCQGGPSAALTATGINLKWYTAPASGTASTTAPVPPTLALGTTPYYVSQTSALNCESPRALINVVVNPIPAAPVVTSPVELCINVPAAALTATGINLKWYTAASGGTGSATAPVPVTTTTGTTNFYVSQTSIVGCESPRATITANVHPSPVLHISPLSAPAFAYCPGAEVTIKATTSPVISYQWYKDALAVTGAVTDTLSVGVNGWYAMLVTDMYGCKTKDSVFVFQDTLPAPKLSPTNVQICTGVTIMMYCTPADAGYQYEWYKEATAMSIPLTTNSIPVNITGVYHVKVTDYYGCSSLTNNALVTNYPAVAKPVIDRKDPVLRVTPSFASYQWYRNGVPIAGATAGSYIMKFDGTYYVEVMDINGCTNVSDTVVVERLAIGQVPVQLPEIKIYPNPTQSFVTIECPVTVNVLITDIAGRSIFKSEHCTQVDMSNYADGMYLFHIFDEQGTPLRIEKINKTAK